MPDKDINFPDFVILLASAGTGKTRALTLRFTQFLLSEKIKHNAAQQILAITFTRNATREMKERIIGWLKKCYFLTDSGKTDRDLEEILNLVTLKKERLKLRAEEILNKILTDYSDFQVTTIDSFMANIFKASAVELGLNPEAEITIDSRPVIAYAFSRLLKTMQPDGPETEHLREICRNLKEMRGSGESFVWDPASQLEALFLDLNRKLAGANRRAIQHDLQKLRKKLQGLEKKFQQSRRRLASLMPAWPGRPKRSRLWSCLPCNRVSDWFGYDFKILEKDNVPTEIWRELMNLKSIINEYKEIQARIFFQPHLRIYDRFLEILNQTRKERGIIFLEDIHCWLANYLDQGVVPDIYFSLGGDIYHYLIDEFQDTSPLQWQNLYPLVENALAQGGSLFLVGDTKQAIYGFREADYQIMVNLIEGRDGFASVSPRTFPLEINWRSRREILNWVSKVFPEGVRRLDPEIKDWSEALLWQEAASKSLLDKFECRPSSEKSSCPGYVEINLIDPKKILAEVPPNDEENSEEASSDDLETPEKKEVQNLIQDLRQRGYNYSDIAILAYENDSVQEAATWLNEQGIPFVPYSALDIRSRQVIREILAFLQFLDYPLDELNFSVFLCGQLFQERLRKDGLCLDSETVREFIVGHRQAADSALYASFRKTFPGIWEAYFESFFKTAGYLPLYDLVSRIYRVFKPLELFPQEEGSLIKLLEVIKNFEGQGKSNLRDFIKFSGEATADQNVWTIDVPENIDAVKIMTIHKAKGLGFPVVILLLYRDRIKPQDFYLREAAPDHSGSQKGPRQVEVLRLTSSISSASPELQAAYKSYRERERVNKLNILYVALTRAQEQLYVIGVKKTNEYPFNLLETVLNCQAPCRLGSAGPRPKAPKRKGKKVNIATLSLLKVKDVVPAPERPGFNYHEKRRGMLIHALLAAIEYAEGDIESTLSEIRSRPWSVEFTPEEMEAGIKIVGEFLRQPEVAFYFSPRPGRRVERELELVDAQGRLFRADRVVVDPDRVTVIDFKTGRIEDPEIKRSYLSQINGYLSMLTDIYPGRRVEGLLMYPDLNKIERV